MPRASTKKPTDASPSPIPDSGTTPTTASLRSREGKPTQYKLTHGEALEFARIVRVLREKQGISGAQMAQVARVSQSTWSRIESGERSFELAKVRMLYTVLPGILPFITMFLKTGIFPKPD